MEMKLFEADSSVRWPRVLCKLAAVTYSTDVIAAMLILRERERERGEGKRFISRT
jgi:hypothetical protein